MLEQEKLVSIYIPTHNRLELLKRALKSVQNQTYRNIEILICDDASDVDTKDYVMSEMLGDSRIRYLRNEIAQGACVARNLGIFDAKGYFITGLDDDDEFTSDRIDFLVSNWEDEYSFICCNFWDAVPGEKLKPFYAENDYVGEHAKLLFENVCSNQIFTITTRLQSIGGFDSRAKRLQDWDTWLRMSFKFGRFKRIGKPKYIMHHDNYIKRVSNSYTLGMALKDLMDRNIELYEENEQKYMEFMIKYVDGNISLSNALYWSFKKKRMKIIAKYFYCILK